MANRTLQLAIEQSGLEPGPVHSCPYLPDQPARHLAFRASSLDRGMYHLLMDLNFRRSGSVFYRPACEFCRECKAIRVPVDQFQPSRAQRRCWQRNRDISVQVADPIPTEEKFQLYRDYVRLRHGRSLNDSWTEFCEFLYDSSLNTVEVIYRLSDRLVCVGLVDVEPRAVSTVYCFFDISDRGRSPGVFNILWMIDYCRRERIPYLYLGYYIRDCAKMNYKLNYRPCEVLGADGQWRSPRDGFPGSGRVA